MSFTSSVMFCVAILSSATSSAMAQESVQVTSGARVRLTTVAAPVNQQIVRIVSTANDSIVFRPEADAGTRSLALSDIATIEVSTGRRRQTLRGAGTGLLVGAGVGALIGFGTWEPCGAGCIVGFDNRTEAGLWGAILVGGVGLLAGTTIGTLVKSDKWQRLQPHTRIRVAPMFDRGRVLVAYRF